MNPAPPVTRAVPAIETSVVAQTAGGRIASSPPPAPDEWLNRYGLYAEDFCGRCGYAVVKTFHKLPGARRGLRSLSYDGPAFDLWPAAPAVRKRRRGRGHRGLFERFTERARQVVVLAQDEARALKHNYIGTEHILLGLLREEEGLAARVLESLDITEQSQQDVLGADVVVLQRPRLILG